MRRWKPIALFVSVALALYALLGFLILPPLVRSKLVSALSAALRRPVQVEAVRLNPFTLSAAVRGVRIADREAGQSLLSLGEVYVDVESSSLWRRGLVIRELRLSAPHVRLVHEGAGRYNVSDLLASEPKDEKSEPFRFAVGNVQIAGGAADFVDRPKGKTHTLRDLHLTLPFVSNFPAYLETFTEPSLSVRVNGKPFSVRGQTKPFADSLETTGDLELRDVELPYYLAYAPLPFAAAIPSARLGARLHVAYAQHRDRGPTLALSGEVRLDDLAVDDAAGRPLLRLPSAAVAFDPLDVFARTLHIRQASLSGVTVDLSRDARGRGNWADLLPARPAGPEAPAPEAPPADEKAPFRYRVDAARLAVARLTFSDASLGRPFRTQIAPLELSAANLANSQGEQGSVRLSLRTENAEEVLAEAALSLAPLRAEGRVSLTGARLETYAPYLRRQLAADLAGRLAASTGFSVEPSEGGRAVRLAGAGLKLQGFSATRAGERQPFARLPSLEMAEAGADLRERRASLGRVTLTGGRLQLRRGADKTWNVQGLVAGPPGGGPGGAAARGGSAEKPAPAERPWELDVQRLALQGVGVVVDDGALPRPAHLELANVAVEGRQLTTARGRRGRVSVSAAVNRRGQISARGDLGLRPLAASLALGVKSLELPPFQGYVESSLQAILTSGSFQTSGTLGLATNAEGRLAAAYRGEAQISRFATAEPSTGDPLLSFGALAFQGLDFRQAPLSLQVAGVSLSDFEGFVTVEPDGTLNLRKAAQPAGGGDATPAATPPALPAAAAGAPRAPRPRIDVGTITLQGGTLHFTDRKIKPSYAASFDRLGGRITGLTSLETGLADVDLRALVDGATPLEITGKMNPLLANPFVDLRLALQGSDLSSATPYSGRYAGYAIEKGKLFLDVRYQIADRKIDAQNLIVLDQFTFGEKVASPEATTLPVRFAVSLLKDRAGKIELDVPVAGSLDDPEFSYGRVVWRVLVNLVTKAVTSPFALLGSLFGGGEELGKIDFVPAEAALPLQANRKVEALAKALQARPALRLELQGHVAADADRRALAELLYLRRLKAQKAKELALTGTGVEGVDALALTAEEAARMLPLAYKAATFPKPKNALGLEKSLPPEEMEKLLRTHAAASDDDLRLLAQRRAEAVRDALVARQVEAARLFVKEPAAAKQGEAGWSGVELQLR